VGNFEEYRSKQIKITPKEDLNENQQPEKIIITVIKPKIPESME
jgi:hypothetical protein